MVLRLAVVATIVIVVASVAGTAIAIGTSGLSDSATVESDSDVADQVEHYLSPGEVEQSVTGEQQSDSDEPIVSGSAAPGGVWVSEELAPPGASNHSQSEPEPKHPSRDTSGDGYPDYLLETAPPLAEHDPNPGRYNVFVEVDYMEGCNPEPTVNRTVAAFADAPVENANGSTGIDLHVTIEEEVPRAAIVTPAETQLDAPSAQQYRKQAHHRADRGYHYVLFVHNAGPFDGFRHADDELLIVECGSGDTFMHELGHALGLSSTDPAIDSRSVDFEAYPSTMNYNRPQDHFEFSTGNASDIDNDDWGTIARSLSNNTPSMALLERRYLDADSARIATDSHIWATGATTELHSDIGRENETGTTHSTDDRTGRETSDGTDQESTAIDGSVLGEEYTARPAGGA